MSCPYCVAAKDLVEENKIKYEWVDSEKNPEIRSKYSKEYNFNTVPMIFVDETFVGGYSEFKSALKDGSIKI